MQAEQLSRPELSPHKIDDISLDQALQDFERANARVLDLAHRLVQAEKRWRSLVNETEQLRLQLAKLAQAQGGAQARFRPQAVRIALKVARRLKQAIRRGSP